MTRESASERPMLEIRSLHASAKPSGSSGADTPILNGLDLSIRRGEVHALMGPNGSGKSTLAHVLAGKPGYRVTSGEVLFEGRDLTAMTPEERARAGVFLAFQYPVEIPEALMSRAVNEGFSGGEKKRNEILQMALLDPKLAVLDETDSGLDIDALRIVASGVNALRGPERAMLVITHYQRLLEYIVPDRVHVLSGGRIVRSGGKELARELEAKGYGWVAQGGESRAPKRAAGERGPDGPEAAA